jgi:hypothetical protein
VKKLALAAFVVATGFSAPSFAQNYYVDLGAGQGKAKGADVSSDRKGVWAARIGARFHPNFAVDVGYEDLGKYDVAGLGWRDLGRRDLGAGAIGTARASSWGVSLVAIAPLERFDIYGRLGYARTESKFDLPGFGSDKSHDNEAFYGVGGRYNFGNLGVFAEWNKHDKVDIDYWLLGVQLRF